MDRDSDGHNVQVVVDLAEAAWRSVAKFLIEGDQPAEVRAELEALSSTLPAGMVAAWVENLWKTTPVADPEDLLTLAEAVTYLITELREDPALEAEDFDRMALSIELEEPAAQA
jgi:hypothetical protein